jgi:uncharacterized short protein YbdD (DUF466 family)
MATTGLLSAVRTGARTVGWYVRGVMGEDAYDKYLDHFEGVHPAGAVPMTEREFWRDRSDRQDANPQSRCC